MNTESIVNKEKLAPIALDEYLEFVLGLNILDGVLIEDEIHLFYWWLTRKFREYQDIDGATLLQLYEKNVLENGMKKETFHEYCLNHNFPSPFFESIKQSKLDRYMPEFDSFVSKLNEQNKAKYEAWAETNGVITAPQSVMVFNDSQGNKYRVRTDFKNHGEILMDFES